MMTTWNHVGFFSPQEATRGHFTKVTPELAVKGGSRSLSDHKEEEPVPRLPAERTGVPGAGERS